MKHDFVLAYIDTAVRFSALSKARKLKVGAIVVKDDSIISIGINGTAPGANNECEYEVPELYDHKTCTPHLVTKPTVIHAEANAIGKLTRRPESSEGSTMFCTHTPCIECAKLIDLAGIKTVYYLHEYVSKNHGSGLEYLQSRNIATVKVDVT